MADSAHDSWHRTYNVSNTCYLNSVLQPLPRERVSRVFTQRRSRDIFVRGRQGRRVTQRAESQFNGWDFRFRGSKSGGSERGESSDGEEAVVPFRKCSLRCFCQHHYFTMGLLFCCLAFGIPDQVIFHVRPSRCMIRQSGGVKWLNTFARALRPALLSSKYTCMQPVSWRFPTSLRTAVRPPAMTRTGKASIAAADHACLGGVSTTFSFLTGSLLSPRDVLR